MGRVTTYQENFQLVSDWYAVRTHALEHLDLATLLDSINFFVLAIPSSEVSGNLIKLALNCYLSRFNSKWDENSLENRAEIMAALRQSTSEQSTYDLAFVRAVNRLSREFLRRFSTPDGEINWNLVPLPKRQNEEITN